MSWSRHKLRLILQKLSSEGKTHDDLMMYLKLWYLRADAGAPISSFETTCDACSRLFNPEVVSTLWSFLAPVCIYVQCTTSSRIVNIDLDNSSNNLARTLINRLLKFNEQTHHSSSHSTSRIYIASRHGYLTSCSSENIIVEEIGLFTVFLYSDVGLHFLLLMLEVYVKILEDLKVKNICYVTCDTDRTLIERVPFFSWVDGVFNNIAGLFRGLCTGLLCLEC